MEKIEAKVDERGRIIIPAAARKKMGIRPLSRVEILIKRVRPQESFLEMARKLRGTFEGRRKNAVELLHEESPFR
jgi:AbrB family looped-hinge helix DNA binding protein